MIKLVGRLCKWKMQGVSPRADRCAELMSRGLKEGVCVHACVHSCMCVHSNLEQAKQGLGNKYSAVVCKLFIDLSSC